MFLTCVNSDVHGNANLSIDFYSLQHKFRGKNSHEAKRQKLFPFLTKNIVKLHLLSTINLSVSFRIGEKQGLSNNSCILSNVDRSIQLNSCNFRFGSNRQLRSFRSEFNADFFHFFKSGWLND